MADDKAVPYIKRLENQRDACIAALKSIEAYHAALERADNTAYRSDALKYARSLKIEMDSKLSEAKNLLGGIYA